MIRMELCVKPVSALGLGLLTLPSYLTGQVSAVGHTEGRLASQAVNLTILKQALEPALSALVAQARRSGHEFRLRNTEVDSKGRTVARYDHYFDGIRVEGSEVIGSVNINGIGESISYPFAKLAEPETSFSLSVGRSHDYSIDLAKRNLSFLHGEPSESWVEVVFQPRFERVFENEAGVPIKSNIRAHHSSHQEIKDWRLIHIVHQLFPQKRESFSTRIDALSGDLLGSTANGSCAPITLQGNAQFNRPNGNPIVTLQGVTSGSTNYLQRDNIFSVNISDVVNPVYSSSSVSFGDGQEYTSGDPAGINGQTQAVDIAWGMSAAYDFYLSLFGRHGIDGSDGYFIPISAHHPNTLPGGASALFWWYRNLFGQESYWIDFTDRFGYWPSGPTEFSVTAHEWTHGVNRRCSRIGTSSGSSTEQVAINEASSTILSTAARLWDWNGRQATLANPDPSRWTYDWAYQPQIMGGYPGSPSPKGVEFLYRPSRPAVLGGNNNIEPSWWTYSKLNWPSDSHAWGAPLHRFFYFLVNGADGITDVTNLDDNHRGRTSPFMPLGFSGVGMQNATLIYYQAFTQTYTESMDLVGAGQAIIQASIQLFGLGSSENKATVNALAAANLTGPYIYNFPSISHTSPSTALVLPTTEADGRYVGTLPVGSSSEYYLVTVPPGVSLTAYTLTPRVPANTPQLQGPGLQVWNATGTTLLASANPVLDNLLGNYLTGGANLSYKNTNASVQTYLVRVYSPQNRNIQYSCTFNVLFDINEITTNDSQALAW